MQHFTRLKPSQHSLAALVSLVWAISFGALRDFVWADLREGLVDLRGLSRVTRSLVLLGFALLLSMTAVLLYSDLWRVRFPLLPLTNFVPGRGTLIPTALIPISLFLLALAWSFLLAGALHSHPAIRLAILGIFMLTALTWAVGGISSNGLLQVLGTGLVVGLLLLFFVLRWRAQPRPGLEFAVLLLLVGGLLSLVQSQVLAEDRLTGMPFGLLSLSSNISLLSSIVLPLLFLIGVDIAQFTRQAAGWVTDIVQERLPTEALYGLLLLVAGWRFWAVVSEMVARLEKNGWQAERGGVVGALGIVLLVGLAWWLVVRGRPVRVDEIAAAVETRSFPLILAYHAPALLSFAVLGLSFGLIGTVALIGILFPDATEAGLEVTQRMLEWGNWLTAQTDAWHILLAMMTLGLTVWLVRRRQRAVALYLGIFSGQILWWELTNPGRPLQAFYWRGDAPLDFWWVVLLIGVGVIWSTQRRLNIDRASCLLFLLLITALLRQTDFIENPFSPFFAFAGMGFVAFGIVWDALTIGSWANQDTSRLPRISRLFLYVGYVLLTVTVINWALATHDLSKVGIFSGDVAMVGFDLFGRPMLYGILVLTLAQPIEVSTLPDDPIARS